VFSGRISRLYKLGPGNYMLSISAPEPIAGIPNSNVLTLKFTAVR